MSVEPSNVMVDTETLLASGNLADLARTPGDGDWRKFAAFAMIGRSADALRGLQGDASPEAALYRGIAHWMEGEETEAITCLRGCDLPHAQKLLALIKSPRIRVLSQLPGGRRGASDLVGHLDADPKFDLHNISTHADDFPVRGGASIHDYYDRRMPPHFYLCANIEWHLVPRDLQQLPCPTIGQTADYDLHIQVLRPWLRVFDELLTCDPGEWADVRRLVDVPVTTYPKSFGVRSGLPELKASARELDFFGSGTLFDNYHIDKMETLFHLLQVPGVSRRLVNGFVGEDFYFDMLRSAKTCFSFVRRPSCMPTRALEAMAMGCAVMAQRGTVLDIYCGENEGLLAYGDGPELARCLQTVASDWGTWEKRAQRGARLIREEFNLERVASQYLRFATVLAARPRGPRVKVPHAELPHRRPILSRGWMPGDDAVMAHVRAEVVSARGDGSDPRKLNDALRELALDAITLRDKLDPTAAVVIERVCRAYRAVLASGSQDLVLCFNGIRFLCAYGAPADREAALAHAGGLLKAPGAGATVALEMDVMPWDFLPEGFNYRRYFDRCTALHLGAEGGDDAAAADAVSLADLVRASLHHLLACATEGDTALSHHRRAWALDDGFCHYGIGLAKALLARGGAAERSEARDVLMPLSQGSLVFSEAVGLLETLCVDDAQPVPGLAAAAAAASHLREDLTDLASTPAGRSGRPAGLPHAASEPYLVTAIVSAYDAERFMRGLLDDLEAQTLADRMEIVICDSNSPGNERAIVEEYQARYDNIVYFRTDERENSHLSLNRCIERARGKYITLANCDDRHAPQAFERMVAELQADPGVGLVYADYAISPVENATLDDPGITGYALLPAFDRRLLFSICYVGPQPMWRRSLHDTAGMFDTELWKAGDYDLWQRFARETRFKHIPELLGLYYLSDATNGRNDPGKMAAETTLARTRNWPVAWGPMPPERKQNFATGALRLSAPVLWADFEQLGAFGLSTAEARRATGGLVRMLRETFSYQDTASALLTLQWLAQSAPYLFRVLQVVRPDGTPMSFVRRDAGAPAAGAGKPTSAPTEGGKGKGKGRGKGRGKGKVRIGLKRSA